MANLLHVLEVLRRVRPDADVHIDRVLTGTEIGFRYGEVGDDVWTRLFRASGPGTSGITYKADFPIDFAFWGTGKDHLTGRNLETHRHLYHSIVLNWLEITNRRVLEEVRRTHHQFLDGRFCIGIHRRVGNAMVADLQRAGYVPSLDLFVKTVESMLSGLMSQGISDYAIFLATDDAEAVGVFRCCFRRRLDGSGRRSANDVPKRRKFTTVTGAASPSPTPKMF